QREQERRREGPTDARGHGRTPDPNRTPTLSAGAPRNRSGARVARPRTDGSGGRPRPGDGDGPRSPGTVPGDPRSASMRARTRWLSILLALAPLPGCGPDEPAPAGGGAPSGL